MFTTRQKRTLFTLGLIAAWLYTFSLLYRSLVTNNDNPRKLTAKLENYIHSAEKKFYQDCTDTATLLQLANRTYSEKQLEKIARKPYAFFVYRELTSDDRRELKFWSANYAFPSDELFQYPEEYGIPVTLGNGTFEFCHRTIKVHDTVLTVACFIPLHWKYFMENDYLKTRFAAADGMERKFEIAQQPSIYPIKNGSGQVLLYLKKKDNERNTGYSPFVMVTRILAVILLFAMIYYVASVFARKKTVWYGFALLLAGFIGLRLLTWFTPFPFDGNRLEVFDPTVYASGALFPSLGHLLLNLMLLFLSMQFLVYHRPPPQHVVPGGNPKPVKATVLILLLLVVTFLCSWLIRSLIADSKIPFDVTNFFNLTPYTILGFIALALTIMFYYYSSVYLLRHIWPLCPARIFLYFVVAVGGLLLLYLRISIFNYGQNIFVLAWLMGYIFINEALHVYRDNPKAIFRNDIIMLLLFSLSSCMVFTVENNKKELGVRKLLAENLAFLSDPSTERLLNTALSRFDNSFLRQNIAKWSDPVTGERYKDTLAKQNFTGYLNKFFTRAFTYDANGNPVNNPDSISVRTFGNLVEKRATRIRNISDLFYYQDGFDQYSYIYYKKIVDTGGAPLGYFVLFVQPKKYEVKSDPVYFELFREQKEHFYESINNYVYAVYENRELRKRFIDYDFPVRLTAANIPLHDDTIIYRKGYQELWHNAGPDITVVVGKKNTVFISTITLFVYIFFAFLITALLYRLIKYLLERQPRVWFTSRLFQFNMRTQVQGIIVFASLLSFLVIGITIISLFRSRFDRNNRDRLSRAMAILEADVENRISHQGMFDDVVKVYEPGVNRQLEEMILQMSEIHNVDFNVYALDGSLGVSSQPYMRNREIIGNLIDPVAFYNLKTRGSGQFIQQEKIGSFKYLSMYVPVRNQSGELYMYLNIPYYASRSDLKQEISNFLVTIINLNAFIFLIAGLIAWLVTSRITRSFLLIGERMKEVNLGKNEVITWKRNDELGGLINKYNEMVLKLEDSAVMLAKNEREGAWREMARQVAHEIKNPLTPMKLSVQFLQKSIAEGNGNVKELTASVTQTLVEQIDHLAKIAADFSQFAHMGNARMEPIRLHEKLRKVATLFSVEPGAEITVSEHAKDTVIKADLTHMNRLFANLVKNALQAYNNAPHKPIELGITEVDEQFAIVEVRDYGPGIEESLQQKIFVPNFTTKSSGTGLGLAISKGIVEQIGGSIWFETSTKGTSFYVKLPLNDMPFSE